MHSQCRKKTSLPDASKVTTRDYYDIVRPAIHVCRHDIQVNRLPTAGELMAKIKGAWEGTLILIFSFMRGARGHSQADN